MPEWNPQQYLRFKQERTQPSIDLVARIVVENPKTIIDIGCGPGNSTQILRKRWPNADVTGMDNSKIMIERARKDYPDQKWVIGDIVNPKSIGNYDIVFSSAVIHWIPGHEVLIPRLFSSVNQSGFLAIQIPANHESSLYQAIIAVSRKSRWSRFTSGREEVITHHPAGYYYNLLGSLTQKMALWETIYYHILNSHQDLIAWSRSTAMKPFLERLPNDEDREKFEQDVLTESRAFYPPQDDGKILYPFKRLFFTAQKS